VPSRDPILIQSRRDPSRRVILLRDFRLNGWQRIGIVLSILSALGGYVLAIVALFSFGFAVDFLSSHPDTLAASRSWTSRTEE
jgi:hypothetical protein